MGEAKPRPILDEAPRKRPPGEVDEPKPTYAQVLIEMIIKVSTAALSFEDDVGGGKLRPRLVAALDKFGEDVRALVESDPELRHLFFRELREEHMVHVRDGRAERDDQCQ